MCRLKNGTYTFDFDYRRSPAPLTFFKARGADCVCYNYPLIKIIRGFFDLKWNKFGVLILLTRYVIILSCKGRKKRQNLKIMNCTLGNPVEISLGQYQFSTMTCSGNGNNAELVSSLFIFIIIILLIVGFFNNKYLGIKIMRSK